MVTVLIIAAGLAGCVLGTWLLVHIFKAAGVLDRAGSRVEHVILKPLRRFVWFEGVQLTHDECHSCAGLGVQMLLHGSWTIIPKNLRNRQTDGSHPSVANSRRCTHCNGLGWRWTRPVK